MTTTSSRRISQDSAGVPDTSEPGDRFGTTIVPSSAFGHGAIAIGAPGEAFGAGRDEGAVWVVAQPGTTLGSGGPSALMLRQGLAGGPGTLEPGDRFGAALSQRWAWGEPDEATDIGLAVGAPGEDRSAGVVTFFSGSPSAPRARHADPRVGGRPRGQGRG